MELLLRAVAVAGAVVHLLFFYIEALTWGVPFVAKAAPSWRKTVGGTEKAEPYVKWAADLAFNVGTYNLLLAVGLAWVAIAGADVAGTLGLFLAIFLLGAAGAALHTGVKLAFYIQ